MNIVILHKMHNPIIKRTLLLKRDTFYYVYKEFLKTLFVLFHFLFRAFHSAGSKSTLFEVNQTNSSQRQNIHVISSGVTADLLDHLFEF